MDDTGKIANVISDLFNELGFYLQRWGTYWRRFCVIIIVAPGGHGREKSIRLATNKQIEKKKKTK